ncbi:MAG: hypothetical protein KBT31_01960 [Firmicutes bacterium]|nr:hypothetical protein [Candidatus Colimorpha enterica]
MKTLKITFATIICLVLVACILSGCGSQKNIYQSFVCDVGDGGGGNVEESDTVDYWHNLLEKKENMKDLSINILGVDYKGKYEYSIRWKYNTFTSDVYRDESGVEFGVSGKEHKLENVNFMPGNALKDEPYKDEVENIEDKLIPIARDVASKFTDDLDKYEVSSHERNTSVYEKDGKEYSITFYYVTFVRKIQGFDSADYIEVDITSKGSIASISFGDPKVSAHNIDTIDKNRIDESVGELVKKIYNGTKYELNGFDIRRQEVVLTPDNDVCMISRVEVELTNQAGEEFRTMIEVLTVIDPA